VERTGIHIAADGTPIWYGTVGSGPSVVLCDGFACDGFIWPFLIDDLIESYQVVRWHYRGHGQSGEPRDTGRVGVEDLCDDLSGVLDALEIDEAIFMGHSMGVQVILQYYGLDPERVKALVPICGTFKRPLDTFHNHDKLNDLLPYLRKLVTWAPDKVQTFWETVTTSPLSLLASRGEINARLVRTSDFAPYLEHVARMNVQTFVTMLSALAEHSTEDILPTIDVPTLIVASENDTFTPLSRSEEMAGMIPDSELLILPGGTHIGPLELPATVNGAIEKFLSDHGF
jgi:pimeloyl-ACP methyl ester carboxylesterase